MAGWGTTLLVIFCGVTGFGVGYAFGFRSGCLAGEMRAVDATIAQLRERRESGQNQDEPATADQLD